MNPPAHFLAIALLVWPAWACTGPRSSVHYAKQVTLDSASPRNRWLGVQLLRVEDDGTTVIQVPSTGETLAAVPGDFFLGEQRPPYDVRVFGEHGLQLVRSDPANQTAVVLRRWAGTR